MLYATNLLSCIIAHPYEDTAMSTCRMTLKNYRCFEDTEPLVLELDRGLTAFVGPNNSGKSSALRFFHEMRELFLRLASVNELVGLVSGTTMSHNLQGLEDPSEIFCNSNNRPLSLTLEFPDADEQHLSKVDMVM